MLTQEKVPGTGRFFKWPVTGKFELKDISRWESTDEKGRFCLQQEKFRNCWCRIWTALAALFPGILFIKAHNKKRNMEINRI